MNDYDSFLNNCIYLNILLIEPDDSINMDNIISTLSNGRDYSKILGISKNNNDIKNDKSILSATAESKRINDITDYKIILGSLGEHDIDAKVTQTNITDIYDEFIKYPGIRHTDSYNILISKGLNAILHVLQPEWLFTGEGSISNPDVDSVLVSLKMDGADLDVPKYQNMKKRSTDPLYPYQAQLTGRTYAADLHIQLHLSMRITFKEKVNKKPMIRKDVRRVKLCDFPIMVGSKHCNIQRLRKYDGHDDQRLREHKYDPSDRGGYFILDGHKWSMLHTGNIANNNWRFFKELFQKDHTVCRGEIICQPGINFENSAYVKLRKLIKGSIALEVDISYSKDVWIPFYLVFLMFGSDYTEMKNYITYGLSGKWLQIVVEALDKAGNNTYSVYRPGNKNGKHNTDNFPDINEVKTAVDAKLAIIRAIKFNATSDKIIAATQSLNVRDIDSYFDKFLFSHVGQRPADRRTKSLHFGLAVQRLILVEAGEMPQSSRYTMTHKRHLGPGDQMAKPAKQRISLGYTKNVNNAFKKLLKEWDPVTMAFSLVHHDIGLNNNLSKEFVAALQARSSLTSSTTTGASVKNTIYTTPMEGKAPVSAASTLSLTKATSSKNVAKTSKASHKLRGLDSSEMLLIDVANTPEGANVGTSRRIGSYTRISDSKSPEYIIKILSVPRGNGIYYPLGDPKIWEMRISVPVRVNGVIKGMTNNPIALYLWLRNNRRKGNFARDTSIHWDNDLRNLHIWTEHGRMNAPMVIVYNNIRDAHMFPPKYRTTIKEIAKDPKKFRQMTLLTPEIVAEVNAGRIDKETLVKQGIIEFVTALEATNQYYTFLDNFNKVRENPEVNCVNHFTHVACELMLFGFSVAIAPLLHHNQFSRATFAGNQARQACGCATLAYAYSFLNETFVQFRVEMPLVTTRIYKLIAPAGINAIVAVHNYKSLNIEDAVILKRSFITRGGYGGVYYKTTSVTLPSNSVFGVPTNRKVKYQVYGDSSKLDEKTACPRKGTKIKKHDKIIGILTETDHDPNDPRSARYKDSSVTFGEDKGVVHAIYDYQNPAAEKEKRAVYVRMDKTPRVGDKFSSRHGQKAIVGVIWNDSDMPYDKDGIIPDMIVNPHGLPSRMTIGQPMESLLSEYAAQYGKVVDASAFTKIDFTRVVDLLKKRDPIRYEIPGRRQLYSPLTGRMLRGKTEVGMVYYHRLRKFGSQAHHSGRGGPKNNVTHQNIKGKGRSGGSRLGWMETAALSANTYTLFDRMNFTSDGFTDYFCSCGRRVLAKFKHNKQVEYSCKSCDKKSIKGSSRITQSYQSWTSKHFVQSVEGACIAVRYNTSIGTEDSEDFTAEDLAKSMNY